MSEIVPDASVMLFDLYDASPPEMETRTPASGLPATSIAVIDNSDSLYAVKPVFDSINE